MIDNAYVDFDSIHLWLQYNTVWLGPAIAIVACLESLVIVGIVLPGVAMLFALAAIAGATSLAVFPILLWAFLGAIIGDGVSFLLGHYYQDRVRGWWPFSRYPQWLEQGDEFFQRYGMLSVVIGRFVGPIRPIIPAVAGMMGMLPKYFFSVNFISALAWAPVYLLPGYLTGAALQWHDKVPDQLLVVLIAIISTSIMFPPLLISLHHRFKPRFILYPVITLGLLALFVVANAIGFLERANHIVYTWLEPIQLPWLTEMMHWITQIGSVPALSVLLAGCLFWQYRSNKRSNMAYLFLGSVSMALSVWLIKWLAESNRPVLVAELDPYVFPSGHTTATAFVFFWFSAMSGERRSFRVQWLWSSMAFGLVMLEAFSRLVLQVHWFGDVLMGLGLGLFWALIVIWAQKRSQCPE